MRCCCGDITRGSATRTSTVVQGAGTAASQATGFFSQHLSQHLHSLPQHLHFLLAAPAFSLQHLSQHLQSLPQQSFSWLTSTFCLQHLSQHLQSFSQHFPGQAFSSASQLTITRGVMSSSTCWVSVPQPTFLNSRFTYGILLRIGGPLSQRVSCSCWPQ